MDEMLKDSTQSKQGNKYLTFALGKEQYGLGIIKIREIIGIMGITHVPQMPPYVKGVVNLRGRIIPVLDLRMRFGMEQADYSNRTCIIVVETSNDKQNFSQYGLLVDGVSEVASIKENEIEEPPTFWDANEEMYIDGVAKVGEKVKILLNIERIVNNHKELLKLAEIN